MKAKNLMYIKQILYLLEKFVTVLGGKGHRAGLTPARPACWARFPGHRRDTWVFCVLRFSWPLMRKILMFLAYLNGLA